MDRINISSGTEFEKTAGYSRAVRKGNWIAVAGTTAMASEKVVGAGSVYEQAKFIFTRIEQAIQESGGQMSDVIRTRMYITDLAQTEGAMRAHGEVFGAIRPAATLVEVSGLVLPELLIEIEADALLS